MPNTILDRLPEKLRLAQNAVNTPEVQDAMRTLAKYNLGVCMPHVHAEDTGEFGVLPHDVVQVEEGLAVRFVQRQDAEGMKAIPVAWQWRDDMPVPQAVCVAQCQLVTPQSGGEYHYKSHSH